jgi:TRAP-type C4-dicarboxylate transport system substrate-binding protein
MRGFRLQLAQVALCLVAVAASGCSSGEGETKAGGTGVPVTLRIGTHDIAATPGGGQIDEFGRRVEQLSGGELRVKPVWRAAGDNIQNWDQRVARLVMSGELDMGLIPSRAWDTEGVTSLRALQAPFLITSDELTAEVVSDEVATDMLSGLDAAGVVGLALLPEGLRHPFGVRGPLLGPEDYAGGSIRAATSSTTMALFEAIGASVNDAPLDSRTHRHGVLLPPATRRDNGHRQRHLLSEGERARGERWGLR